MMTQKDRDNAARTWNISKIENIIKVLENDHRFETDHSNFTKKAEEIMSECITELECLISDYTIE